MIESPNTFPEPEEESTPGEFSEHVQNKLLVFLCDSYNQKFLPMLIALGRGGDIGSKALGGIVGCDNQTVATFLRRLNDLIPGSVRYKKQGNENKWSGTDLMTWLKNFAAKYQGQTPLELQRSFITEQKKLKSE